MVFTPYDSTKRTRVSESDKLCRLCLCRGEQLIDVFDQECPMEEFLVGMIKDMLTFEVVKIEGVPWFICKFCLTTLNGFRVFKSRCLDSRRTWEDRFERRLEPQERNVTEWPDLCNVTEKPNVEKESVEEEVEDDSDGDVMELGELLLAENIADDDEIMLEIADDDNIYLTFPSCNPEGNMGVIDKATTSNKTDDISVKGVSTTKSCNDGKNSGENAPKLWNIRLNELSEDADRRKTIESQCAVKINNVTKRRGVEIGSKDLNVAVLSGEFPKPVSIIDKIARERIEYQCRQVSEETNESFVPLVDDSLAHQNTQLTVSNNELLASNVVDDVVPDSPEVDERGQSSQVIEDPTSSASFRYSPITPSPPKPSTSSVSFQYSPITPSPPKPYPTLPHSSSSLSNVFPSQITHDRLENKYHSRQVLEKRFESVVPLADGRTSFVHENTQLTVSANELLASKAVGDIIPDSPVVDEKGESQVNEYTIPPSPVGDPNQRRFSADILESNNPNILPEMVSDGEFSEYVEEEEIDVEHLEEDTKPLPVISASTVVNESTLRNSVRRSKGVTTSEHGYTINHVVSGRQQTTTPVNDEVNPSSSQPKHAFDGLFRVSESEFHEIANNVFLGCDDDTMDTNLPLATEIVMRKSVLNGSKGQYDLTQASRSAHREVSRHNNSLLRKNPSTEVPAERSSVRNGYQDDMVSLRDLRKISRLMDQDKSAQRKESVIKRVTSGSISECRNRPCNFEDTSVSERDLRKIERLVQNEKKALRIAERVNNRRPVNRRRSHTKRESPPDTDPVFEPRIAEHVNNRQSANHRRSHPERESSPDTDPVFEPRIAEHVTNRQSANRRRSHPERESSPDTDPSYEPRIATNRQPANRRRSHHEGESSPVTDSVSEPRRSLLNFFEQQRRNDLYKCFMDLKRVIPSISQSPRSAKVMILRESIKCCREMKEEESKRSSILKSLKIKNVELKRKLASLRNVNMGRCYTLK